MTGDSLSSTSKQYFVAIVKKTCGIGCGVIGKPGIEIEQEKLNRLYLDFCKSKKFDTLIFYELGRNFWFYDDQLTCENPNINEAMRTGFAVFTRIICTEKLKISATEINGCAYPDYLDKIKRIYLNFKNDSTLTMKNTLFWGELPAKSELNVTLGNFWASVLLHLYETPGFGEPWINKVWQEVSKQPTAITEFDVLNNFYNACCSVCGKDLKYFFKTELKWTFLG